MQITESLRDQLLAWLSANDVSAEDIPHDAFMTYADGQLTTELYFKDADGAHVMDPRLPNGLARTSATYAVTSPPPDVAWWLRSTCPTCGR